MTCIECQAQIAESHHFCPSCGHPIGGDKEQLWKDSLRNVLIVFFITVIAIFATMQMDTFSYKSVLTVDAIAYGIMMVLALVFYKSIKPYFRIGKIDFKALAAIVVLMPVYATLVHLFVSFLAGRLDLDQHNYAYFFLDSPYPVLLALLSTAVIPAIMEELIFRGVIQTELDKFMTAQGALWLTSILFVVIHFDILAYLWMIPLAAMFCYARTRYKSLFYPMLMHFIYNGTVVMLDFIDLAI